MKPIQNACLGHVTKDMLTALADHLNAATATFVVKKQFIRTEARHSRNHI